MEKQHTTLFVLVCLVVCLASACVGDDGECLDPEGFQGEHGCVYPDEGDELAVLEEDDLDSLEHGLAIGDPNGPPISYSSWELSRRNQLLASPYVFYTTGASPTLAGARFWAKRGAVDHCGRDRDPVLETELKVHYFNNGDVYVERYWFCKQANTSVGFLSGDYATYSNCSVYDSYGSCAEDWNWSSFPW